MKTKIILSILLSSAYLSINTFGMDSGKQDVDQIIENNNNINIQDIEEKKEHTFKFQESFWDDFNQVKKLEIFTDEEGSANVTITKDLHKKSASFCYEKEYKNKESKLLLSINGGGIRGLFPAVCLSIIEEYINDPVNFEFKKRILDAKKENNRWLRINDIFEAGAGTSIGSILIAYIFSKEVYAEGSTTPSSPKMVDALKILKRYGYKIFDQHKNYNPTKIAHCQFDNKGLEILLKAIFGNQTLNNHLVNPVYIPTLNETTSSKWMFTNECNNTKVKACLSSAAAQTYFPFVIEMIGNQDVQLSDGGFIENNPSHSLYLGEKKKKEIEGKSIKIFSFGTGENDSEVSKKKVRTGHGSAYIEPIIRSGLTSQEKTTNDNFFSEMQDDSSRLASLFYINPQMIGESYDLSDCSYPSIMSMFNHSAQIVRCPVFLKMLESLGLECPNDEKMKDLITRVKRKTLAFSNSDYDQMTELEKEYILSELSLGHFDTYQYASYIDEDNMPKLMTHEETEDAKNKIIKGLSQSPGLAEQFLYAAISCVSNNVRRGDFMNAASKFHYHSMKNTSYFMDNEKIKLFKNKIIEESKGYFTTANVEIKMQAESFVLWSTKSEKGSFLKGKQALNENSVQHVINLCAYFIECCNSVGINDTWDKAVDFVASIFWKNCFASLRILDKNESRQSLINLREVIDLIASEVKKRRSFISVIDGCFRHARVENLSRALQGYMDEVAPEPKETDSSCHIF